MTTRHTTFFIALMTTLTVSYAAQPQWRAEAEARIRQHRQSAVEITILNPAGVPVSGAKVQLEMRQHAFLFGTAVNEPAFLNSQPNDPYRTHLRELFNGAVLENWMKWKLWETASANRAATDRIVDTLLAEGLTIRGHTMVWQCSGFGGTYPQDIATMIADPSTDSRQAIRQRITHNIQNSATHFRNRVVHWDVVNELSEWAEISTYLTPGTPRGKSADVANWFRTAHSADPNARLYINDYHILVGDFSDQKNTYEQSITDLLEAGAPLQGIGFQSHFHGGSLRRTPEQTYATLERFARFGLPMAITEYDAYGDEGWGDSLEEREQTEAEFLEEFLITCFSHPQVEAFFCWGFWDGAHWTNNSPFFRKDWTPKPALDVYKRLVFKDWWTDRIEKTTDPSGTAAFRVFNGKFDVKISYNGYESLQPITIDQSATHHVLVLPKISEETKPPTE